MANTPHPITTARPRQPRLPAAHRDVLDVVRLLAGRVTTVGELASRSGCSRGHTYRVVRGLVAAGLIGREHVIEGGAVRGMRLWSRDPGPPIGAAA